MVKLVQVRSSREREMLHKQPKNYVFMTGSQHFTGQAISNFSWGQCAKSSYLKLGSRKSCHRSQGNEQSSFESLFRSMTRDKLT